MGILVLADRNVWFQESRRSGQSHWTGEESVGIRRKGDGCSIFIQWMTLSEDTRIPSVVCFCYLERSPSKVASFYSCFCFAGKSSLPYCAGSQYIQIRISVPAVIFFFFTFSSFFLFTRRNEQNTDETSHFLPQLSNKTTRPASPSTRGGCTVIGHLVCVSQSLVSTSSLSLVAISLSPTTARRNPVAHISNRVVGLIRSW
ncbi:hypothetical protein BDV59DRAFT_29177 [Aspergillus ambiguus]|uniref:uncharacterized protein n=1 Tax=Aspergillus ambiguus TaxID=176160 RepID=UPI003CCDEA77